MKMEETEIAEQRRGDDCGWSSVLRGLAKELGEFDTEQEKQQDDGMEERVEEASATVEQRDDEEAEMVPIEAPSTTREDADRGTVDGEEEAADVVLAAAKSEEDAVTVAREEFRRAREELREKRATAASAKRTKQKLKRELKAALKEALQQSLMESLGLLTNTPLKEDVSTKSIEKQQLAVINEDGPERKKEEMALDAESERSKMKKDEMARAESDHARAEMEARRAEAEVVAAQESVRRALQDLKEVDRQMANQQAARPDAAKWLAPRIPENASFVSRASIPEHASVVSGASFWSKDVYSMPELEVVGSYLSRDVCSMPELASDSRRGNTEKFNIMANEGAVRKNARSGQHCMQRHSPHAPEELEKVESHTANERTARNNMHRREASEPPENTTLLSGTSFQSRDVLSMPELDDKASLTTSVVRSVVGAMRLANQQALQELREVKEQMAALQRSAEVEDTEESFLSIPRRITGRSEMSQISSLATEYTPSYLEASAGTTSVAAGMARGVASMMYTANKFIAGLNESEADHRTEQKEGAASLPSASLESELSAATEYVDGKSSLGAHEKKRWRAMRRLGTKESQCLSVDLDVFQPIMEEDAAGGGPPSVSRLSIDIDVFKGSLTEESTAVPSPSLVSAEEGPIQEGMQMDDVNLRSAAEESVYTQPASFGSPWGCGALEMLSARDELISSFR